MMFLCFSLTYLKYLSELRNSFSVKVRQYCNFQIIPHPCQHTYHLGSSVISHHPVVCYLGVLVDSKLNWNEHYRCTPAKAAKSLDFLRRCLYSSLTMISIQVYCPSHGGICYGLSSLASLHCPEN